MCVCVCVCVCARARPRACVRGCVRAFVRACVPACLPACLRSHVSVCLSVCLSVSVSVSLSLPALEIHCFRVGLCQLRLGVLSINNNIHRYRACAIQRNCVFCVNVLENEEHLYMSQNAVTASLENVLSWKSKTNMFRLAKFATRRRKEFTGSN